jgi:hypothetical protein
LNRAILKNKQGSLARVWYLLHANDSGQGWIFTDKFISLISSGLKVTTKHAKGLLTRGLGVWWTQKDDHRVNINSIIRMCNYFDVKPGFSVMIPNRVFKTLFSFHAYLYSSWFARDTWKTVNNELKPTGGKTISIKAQMKLFGVCKTTLLKWQKATGMVRKTQYAYVKEFNKNSEIPEHVINGFVSYYDIDGDGEKEIVWQIPNRLSIPALEAHKTCLNKNRKLGCSAPLYTGAGPRERIYYDDPNALQKINLKKNRGNTKYFYSKINKKKEASYRLYEAVTL